MEPLFRGELAFCSNMHEEQFYFPAWNLVIDSVEHGFQAAKTLAPEERAYVLAAPTPQKSKKRGWEITLRPDWDAVRLRVMEALLEAKFARGHLRTELQRTGDLELIETNYWHDQFWGDCFCRKHAETPGENHLGRLLTELRAKL